MTTTLFAEPSLLTRRLYEDPVELGALHEALAVRERDFHDETVPASRLTMNSETGSLVLDGRVEGPTGAHEHVLQDHALGQIASRLRIPGDYLKRCPPELQADNVNHWLRGLGEKPLLVRFDRDEVRAVLSSRYVPVSNVSVAERLLKVTKDPRVPVKFEVSALRFVAQVVTNRKGHNVRPGDLVQGGATVENSEVGHASLSLTGYLLRLICTNGMTTSSGFSFRRVHTAEREKVLDQVEKTFHQLGSGLKVTVEHFTASFEFPIRKPEKFMERVNRQFKVSELEKEAIKRAWPLEAGERLFHVVNAYTRAANDPALDLESRSRLQRIGGRVLTDVQLIDLDSPTGRVDGE